MLVRVVDGTLKPRDRILLMATGAQHDVRAGRRVHAQGGPRATSSPRGEVGFVIAGIKELQARKVGDTVTALAEQRRRRRALPGFKEIQPQVFAGPVPDRGQRVRRAARRAREAQAQRRVAALRARGQSQALGFGFRCGFLGLLHMEIVQERLEREYDHGPDHHRADGGLPGAAQATATVIEIENPSKLPDLSRSRRSASRSSRSILHAAGVRRPGHDAVHNQKRGVQMNMQYHGRQVMLTYELPLAEIVMDFFDKLKSVSRGYASMDYEFKEYRAADVVKVDILINGEQVDALSIIVHRGQRAVPRPRGRAKMRELIPRQMFDVAIQAAIGAKIIARETIKALRKNVLAKCYGGDITRKRKLLEKQKAGKKRMKRSATSRSRRRRSSPSCRSATSDEDGMERPAAGLPLLAGRMRAAAATRAPGTPKMATSR